MTNEQYKELERIQKKKKTELTEEEKRRLEEAKEKKKNADAAISILRGISIRLPLLMYGADLEDEGQDITLENFAGLIDDQSWEEFMPRGVTKELFAEFAPYYDPDMFRAVGRNYRDLVRAADKLAPTERTREVARIFSYFRNPDKETVLTPWRVVNMHIGDCIGGRVFYDTDMQTELLKPRLVDHGEVTEKVFRDPDTRILEINSKTGLYPLYMAYSVFAEKLQAYRDSHMLATDVPPETQNEIWDGVLKDNIFVICKTEMAKSITKRTLRGFRQTRVNARYFEDLINKITNQPDLFLMKVIRGKSYWNNKEIEDNMKFNAVVGNPPYQVMDGGTHNGAVPIYHKFVSIADSLNPQYLSMIMPSRWYAGGRGLDAFRDSMLHNKRVSLLVDFADSKECFSSADIAGGVCYFLQDNTYNGPCRVVNVLRSNRSETVRNLDEFDIFIRDNIGISILRKVLAIETSFMQDRVYNLSPFGLRTYVRGKEKPFRGCITLLTSEGKSYILPSEVVKNQDIIEKYKVIIGRIVPSNGEVGLDPSKGYKAITQSQVLFPNEISTETYLLVSVFDTETEARNCADYLMLKFPRFMLRLTYSSMNVNRANFPFVPFLDFKKQWTDSELYKMYGLSPEETAYVESLIKPMGGDRLFDADEYVDPKFANFSLSECGVKSGDRIVYTPTGAVLTVKSDNEVEYEGETYTLAQFTAKYMPRNKRSVSGVCQGPKYFAKGGTSLYLMRESFLGGKK